MCSKLLVYPKNYIGHIFSTKPAKILWEDLYPVVYLSAASLNPYNLFSSRDIKNLSSPLSFFWSIYPIFICIFSILTKYIFDIPRRELNRLDLYFIEISWFQCKSCHCSEEKLTCCVDTHPINTVELRDLERGKRVVRLFQV